MFYRLLAPLKSLLHLERCIFKLFQILQLLHFLYKFKVDCSNKLI